MGQKSRCFRRVVYISLNEYASIICCFAVPKKGDYYLVGFNPSGVLSSMEHCRKSMYENSYLLSYYK